ncbi:EVI5L, partial [Symbiodinium sp. CCMP2456]
MGQGAVQATADETPAFLGTEATDSVPETRGVAEDAKERGSEPSQPSLRRYSVHLLEHNAAELLRTCFCPWANLRDILYADAVCKRWHQLSREEQWMEMSILHGGVTASLRRALWRHLSAVQTIEQRYQHQLGVASATEAFEALLKKPLSQAKISEIERDVHRTYPSHERFEGQEGAKGRAELQQVLQATVTAEPNVGYCQGMNFVAATLLIHLGSASDAFWMLLALLESYHYRFVFAPGVPLLPLRVFQFAGIVQRCLPRLWRHLKEDGHSLEIFAHQCVCPLRTYEAVFRIGASLLAFLEDQLLQMDLEDISHHLHQCKKHLRLPRHNGQLGPAAFRVLLRFDVGLGSLEELESGFQLQRLEVLLSQVSVPGEHDAQVPAVDEPLPAGLERSSSLNGFLVDGNSLRSENLPPRGGTVVGSPSTLLNQAGTKEALPVNLAELKELKVELLQFDEQTQFDVKQFRHRIAEADKELLGLLRSSAEFRMEVEDAESAWKKKQAYRKALMDAVQVAVDSARPSEPMEAAPQELVADCREKLQRVQIEILEDERRRQARLAEFNELCEDIAELREVKQRSMLQLQSFLELRDQQRQGRLKNAVAQLMPLAPVDLN